MKPPTETEVYDYIKAKKGWPDEFCKYLTEKFWNFYESKGWLVGRVKMKSWQAAFNSQWQQLREEDIKVLEKMQSKVKPKVTTETELGRLDALLAKYKFRFESVSNDDLLEWYEFLLINKLRCKITSEDIDFIKQSYGEDRARCRAAVVRMTFDWMINNSLTFSELRR